MQFINYSNLDSPKMGKVNKEQLVSALLEHETKNKSRVDKLVEGLEDEVEFSTALSLFTDKLKATSVLSVVEKKEVVESAPIKEASNTEILDLVDNIHNIIKELKNDSSKDSKKTSKLFNDAKPLVSRLHSLVESFEGYDSAHSVINEFENDIAPKFESSTKLDWDSLIERVNEAGMNDPVLMAFRAAKMKREKELAKPKRKPLYGKQRQKAEDQLWDISQELKELYAERGQLLIDMEQEAEVEGGPIADEYGTNLDVIEIDIQNLIAKRNKLEMRLAESVVNEAFIGPFVFNDRMSDEELKAMYDGALDGYANYSKGFQHSKSNYKQAYQEIEKILKKRGVIVEESAVTEDVLCEATVIMDAMDPKDKNFLKFLKKNNVDIINAQDAFNGWEITMQGKRKDLEAVLADDEYGWDDPELAEYIEESAIAGEVNERSINKIQKEWSKVTVMMKDILADWKKAEGQEKEDLLTQLKTLTISKNKLEAELDAAIGLKDADVELVGEATMQEIDKKVQKFVIKNANDYEYSNQDSAFQIYLSLKKLYPKLIKESVVTEAKPAGLTKEETLKVAQKFADAIAEVDGVKVTVNMKTLEEDSFDLDYDGTEFDGGSYNINADGSVVNMAVRKQPTVGTKDDDVKTIVKFMKKHYGKLAKNESVVTEGKDDYVARYSGTNITLKKGYKHHTEDELQKLYNKIGELVKDDLKVKDVTIVFESEVNEDLRSDLKKFIDKNREEIDNLVDNDAWDKAYTMVLNDFNVDQETPEGENMITLFNELY